MNELHAVYRIVISGEYTYTLEYAPITKEYYVICYKNIFSVKYQGLRPMIFPDLFDLNNREIFCITKDKKTVFEYFRFLMKEKNVFEMNENE